MIWVWLIGRMLVMGLGAYCAGRSEDAYANLHQALDPRVPERLYSFLGDDKAQGMAIVGYSVAALTILLAFAQERATAKIAVQAETETLFWLEELNTEAAAKLGSVMRTTSPTRELVTYHSFLLRAAIRAWSGKGNHANVRLAYCSVVRIDNDVVVLEPSVSVPPDTFTTISVKAPYTYLASTRRFGRLWGTANQFSSFARKGVVQIPVRSPLDPDAKLVGVVVGDSAKRRTFKGEGPRIGAACLGQWLGAGELAARPDLRIDAGIAGQARRMP